MRSVSALAFIMSLALAQVGFAKDCKLTVYFGLNEDQLTPDMQQVLFSFIQHNPNAYGNVIGHTDALASQSYNIELSRRRAMSVVNFIEQYRANSVSLATDWRGKMDLVVNSPGAEPMNRRVEIYFRDCANVGFFSPLPRELRGYETDIDDEHDHHDDHGDDGDHHHEEESHGSSASASASNGSTSATSTSGGNSAAASASNSTTSATSTGHGNAASASAGPNGVTATSAGSSGSSAAAAGNGSTAVSSTGD